MKAKKKAVEVVPTRSDGRKPVLLYLKEDLVRRLKISALDEGKHAYEIAEDALKIHLARRSRRKING